MSTGLAFPRIVEAISGGGQAVDPDELWVRKFAADFGLTKGQERQLRIVVRRRRDEELDVFRNAGPELPAAMQARLSAAQRLEQMRVRALLNDEQRRRYDRKVEISSGGGR
jgi:hypothetical protein